MKRQKDKKSKRRKYETKSINYSKCPSWRFLVSSVLNCPCIPLHEAASTFGKYSFVILSQKMQKYSTNHIVNCKWENTIYSKCYTHMRSFFASPLKVFKLSFLEKLSLYWDCAIHFLVLQWFGIISIKFYMIASSIWQQSTFSWKKTVAISF